MGDTKRIESLGMQGEMGRVVELFHLHRQTGEEKWQEKAETLLDEVMSRCSSALPVAYGSGLCGIGVGIEYLIQEGFVEGDSDEVLNEVDYLLYNVVNGRAIRGLSMENGVCGVGYYFYFRLRKRKDSDSITVLRTKEHLIYLIDWIADLLPETKHLPALYDTFFLLCQLHTLNVFNAKVEKLMEYCLKEIEELQFWIRSRSTRKNLILVGNKHPSRAGLNKIIDSFDYVLRISRMNNLGAAGSKIDGIYLEANHNFKHVFKGGENKGQIKKARNIFMHENWYKNFAEWELYLAGEQYRNVEIINHNAAMDAMGHDHPTSPALALGHLLHSSWRDKYNIYITCLDVEGRAELIDNNPFWSYHKGGGTSEETYFKSLINLGIISQIEDE